MTHALREENAKHKRAFEAYYALGPGRRYAAVAKDIGVSLPTVKLWGRRFGWQARVQERDLDVARAAADRTFSGEREATRQQIQLVRMALFRAAKAIAEGQVGFTVADIDRLIRLERFLMNEPDSRTEHVVGDLSGRSREELEAMLADEVKLLRRLGLTGKQGRKALPKTAEPGKGKGTPEPETS
ncbi:MAG: hypothetical protein Q8R92_17365 [Deltaproteobacteria bacterium]|nr:hypothetical protein [Deltaproteobacteria bacterium]